MPDRWVVRDWVRGGRCLVPVLVYPPGHPHEALSIAALIDTGAMRSAIDRRLADWLRLPPAAYQREVSSPADGSRVPVYQAMVDILSPGDVARVVSCRVDLTATISPMVGGSLLIGMDVIEWAGRFRIENSVWELGPASRAEETSR